ncbi:MAG: hypothetical protein RX318_03975 [bacterium]|nr:hypothetical protein [bacterium]
MSFLIGRQHVITALQPDADRYNADPATDIFNMENYAAITFILMEGVGGTGTATITMEECTDNAGAGATAIAFNVRAMPTIDTWGALTAVAAAGYLTIAGANKMVAFELKAEELSDGSPFVRLQVTETVDSPVDAAIVAILHGARYPQDIPVTAIS